jgi:nucleoside 2-deoxyribosyltransferase
VTIRPKLCILGQIIVDVTLCTGEAAPKLRFGGIAHAARTAWAMETAYVLAYFAPEYLDDRIVEFASKYGNAPIYKIGNVLGCPNVLTIAEPTEAGPQGYQFLLREEQKTTFDTETLSRLCADRDITDFMIFPGGFDLDATLRAIGKVRADIHIDINYEPENPGRLGLLERPFATTMLSTSSSVFKEGFEASVARLCDCLLPKYSNAILFKENRGGSRFFAAAEPTKPIRVPSQTRPIVHSVGVGDCLDIAYIIARRTVDQRTALAYASCVAAEYASTTYPDDFHNAVAATLRIKPDEIVQLSGVSLPWEERSKCQIYIAAPDFEHTDKAPIEHLVDCLKYHNFSPRRPVKENGEMEPGAAPQRRQDLCDADLKLLEECQLMVAVLLYDDPGTLIEIGIAIERNMPVIVFDPYRRARNLMLTQLPTLTSHNLDEVVCAVFKYAARRTE